MAIQRSHVVGPERPNPVWPDRLSDPATMRLIYGEFADELVVLFDDRVYRDAFYAWVTTPENDYAAVKIDGSSGRVIGVMVYPLAAYAVTLHPAWTAATTPDPQPSVAERIVADIKQLFDRFGIGTEDVAES